MFEPPARAAANGLAVELADLGDFGALGLISEYDPKRRTIRINLRALAAFGAAAGAHAADSELIDFATAHELYHHREAVGEVRRLPSRREREAAANAYARSAVTVSPRLAAFLHGRIAD